jgi:hypothetical protein
MHGMGVRDMEPERACEYARFTPTGRVSTEQMSRLIIDALVAASERRTRRLLVDLRALDVIARPTWVQYYDLGEALARAGRGGSRIAFVLAPEDLKRYELTLLVASNRGLPAAGFATEAEAVAWLRRD